jgi:hypothetical protein
VEVTWALIVESWKLSHPDKIGLLDVVNNVQPTVLIGVSGQAGAFSEPIVRAMAECNKRPVIFPLSNPTSREEATTADIEAWTEGRTLIGVGSPFPPIMRDGSRFKVGQTNNSYIFPVSTSVTITVWLCPARPRSIERAAWIRTTSARDRFVAWVRPYSLGSPSLKSRGCVHTHRMMRLFVLFVVEPCIRTRTNPL